MTQENPDTSVAVDEGGTVGKDQPAETDDSVQATDSATPPGSDIDQDHAAQAESTVEPRTAKKSAGDDVAALEEECDVAADYLEELLDIADLDGDIDSYVEGSRAHVSVLTDAEVLVGEDAKVLEALQELCRLAVMTETGRRSRLMLDIGGHRDRRRAQLRELAADAIGEVKSSGDAVALASMNPFERKIVHDAVAEAGFRSESEGEEPSRRVVVMPAG